MKHNILIVDDDPALWYLYSKMKVWERYGFKIMANAANGREALRILEQRKFDVVMTDIRMPDINGLELLKKMRERKINEPTVVISSCAKFEYVREALVLGAFDYLVKPIKVQELVKVLLRLREELKQNSKQADVDENVIRAATFCNIDFTDSQFFGKVCVFLSKHIGDWVTMEDVANEMKLSKDYFGKNFKQLFNISFNQFYNTVKVEYAKMLIDTQNRKNYEICEILGYSSSDYFTRVFKNITGMTPADYRRITYF